MSGFVGAALPVNIDRGSSQRLNWMNFRPETLFMSPSTDAIASFETMYWPRGGGLIGDSFGDTFLLEPVWWSDYDEASGDASRYGFVGVSRDVNGTPIPGVTLKLFLTADDVKQDTTTSDNNGAFLLNTVYYPNAHYIKSHKAGTPDVDGITVDTLIAT